MARVTVVNDYPEFIETMYAILDGVGGHQVAGFNGEETTLEQIVRSDPELLIVDLRIAGDDMRGWDTLMLARADERLRGVPLVVCSADIDTLRARADEFRQVAYTYTLEKPFSVDELMGVVAEALAGKASGGVPPLSDTPPDVAAP